MAIDIEAVQARQARKLEQRGRVWRWLLGALLVVSAAEEIFNLRGFVELLGALQLLPPEGNWLVALTVPFVELAAGLCLLSGFRTMWASRFGSWWFLLQFAAISLALWRGLELPRLGYVGIFAQPLGWWSAVEACVLAIFAWSVMLRIRGGVSGILH